MKATGPKSTRHRTGSIHDKTSSEELRCTYGRRSERTNYSKRKHIIRLQNLCLDRRRCLCTLSIIPLATLESEECVPVYGLVLHVYVRHKYVVSRTDEIRRDPESAGNRYVFGRADRHQVFDRRADRLQILWSLGQRVRDKEEPGRTNSPVFKRAENLLNASTWDAVMSGFFTSLPCDPSVRNATSSSLSTEVPL